MKHIKRFITGKKAIELFRAVLRALDLYAELKPRGAYDAMGTLRVRLLIGERFVQGSRQRRRARIFFPQRTRGRPNKDDATIFVSYLAFVFAKATERPVTLNREAMPPSLFEDFLKPILAGVGIFDVRGWIAIHLKARKRTV